MQIIMYKSTNYSFSFRSEQLAEKLVAASTNLSEGYWQYQAEKPAKNQSLQNWFLGVYRGKIVYSGAEKLSWKSFLQIMVRYIPGLRPKLKQALLKIGQKIKSDRRFCLSKMLEAIEKTAIITKKQAVEALELKILADFDSYLFTTSGTFKFCPQPRLVNANSGLGFDLKELTDRAKQRRAAWQKLKKQIPCLNAELIIDSHRVSKSKLNKTQKQRLYAIFRTGKTLQEIATNLGRDNLEIAKIFAPFLSCGLIRKLPEDRARNNDLPKILIVDDSPILTKQFKNIVTKWGYELKSCHDPNCALDLITKYRPQIIFIDINMPGVCGFDLVKSIRKKSEIAKIPTVILTAENKLSNKWRANWSSCRFLIKPIAIENINLFKSELRSILQELLPTTENTVEVA